MVEQPIITSPDLLALLGALGVSITPHADRSYGWGYTWQGRDWAGPFTTPSDALQALQFRSDYSWLLFAQPGERWQFDAGEGWTPVKEEAAYGRDGIDQVEAYCREIEQGIHQDPEESTDRAEF